VMNSLGKKNSWSQWEDPSLLSRCLAFIHFRFGWVGGRGEGGIGGFFFHFSLVPNVFTLSSLQVPNMFPNMFSIAPQFYPICFGKCCPPFTHIDRPKGRNSMLQNITFCFGELSRILCFLD
jgi:hypothetical protein